MAEAVAAELRRSGYNVLMAILSNYVTEALVKARVAIPFAALAGKEGMPAEEVASRIATASHIEDLSPYRAVTSNKGLMNGVEAVVLASGNDTRAVNASLHAFAAKGGQYKGLTQWRIEGNKLIGTTTLPLMLGVVGGSIGIVPAVKLNHQIMGNPTANELTSIVAAVALAQNLSAIRALVTSGIQSGHMALQAKSLALQVGATENEVPLLVEKLQKNKRFDMSTAAQLLQDIRKSTL
jgi:hydroxymethylglutaryl-CoA reductase